MGCGCGASSTTWEPPSYLGPPGEQLVGGVLPSSTHRGYEPPVLPPPAPEWEPTVETVVEA